MSRAYPRYVETGSPGIGFLPNHWALRPLKTVISCNDEVLPEATEPETEFNYVEISGVEFGRGITETTRVRFAGAPSRARRIVREGDVLVSTVRTYLRAIAQVVGPADDLIASTGFAVLRPREIESGFLGYLAVADFLVGEVISRSVGVSYPAINASELVRLKVPLPPLQEQRAIASFLDRETGKIDALVEEQRRLIALLREKRQAVISHAVTKGLDPTAPMKDSGVEWLGEIPAHWEVQRLGNLVTEVSERGDDELPILSVSIHSGVTDEEADPETAERKVTRSEDRTKYKRVSPGDLVYNMMRAWQGGFGTVQVEGMVSPAYVVARPKSGAMLQTSIVEKLLRSPQAVEELRRHSRGITDFRLRLYWDEFKNIRVPVAPRAEQDEIEESLAAEMEKMEALASEAERAISLLLERRSALISAAVTGKIDVRGEVPETTEAA